MKIGLSELLVVFIVALFVIGPDKMPYYAKKFGEALGAFRKFSNDATKEIRESIAEPLEEAQRPLREAMEPVTELEKTLQGDVREIKRTLSDIGKGTFAQAKEKQEKDAETGADTDTKTDADTDMEMSTEEPSGANPNSGTPENLSTEAVQENLKAENAQKN